MDLLTKSRIQQKTNPKVTVAGKIMKHGGRGIILFSAGIEIYTIWNTPLIHI